MFFYDRDWALIGTKAELAEEITRITTIPVAILLHKRDPTGATIGEKLSWAAVRSAMLEEEVIYSLISLLRVPVDMRRGEGKTIATVRMQEQILGNLEDYTVLMREKPLGLASQAKYPAIESELDDPEETMEHPNWSQVELHSPINVPTVEALPGCLPRFAKPPDSPQLTSKGLRVSLFTKKVRSYYIA